MNVTPCLDDTSFQRFIENELPAHEQHAADAHLATCTYCQRRAAEYKQLMWDLQRPAPAPLPEELAAMQPALLAEWHHQHEKRQEKGLYRGGLIPAWAGHSVRWTRHLPGIPTARSLLARAGQKLSTHGSPGNIVRRLWQRKGDDRR